MFNGDALFKIYKINKLSVDNLSIEKTDNYVRFIIEGKDNNDNYKIIFLSSITSEELYKFKINEEIDFNKYLLNNETKLIVNDEEKVLDDYTMVIDRYTEDNYLIDIKFNDKKNLLGEVEISFSYIEE